MNSSTQFKEQLLSSGDVIFKIDDPCECSYIVKSGNVICFSLSTDNRIIPTFSVKDNGVIGEDNVFSQNEKHLYYAVALTDVILIRIPNAEVMTFLDSSSDWMKRIIFDLGEKVLKTMDTIVEHKILDDRLHANVVFSSEEEALLLKAIS
ncbi:MAG: cyclic nucleotide-binding domain-containing protein [Halobacteriovoraceae bacterium]|jgi:CRP-like cAMP-binding protein|nr:cyclic nucleotide-binding domain-containing protein [Halobacteriovoraceae bacterium]